MEIKPCPFCGKSPKVSARASTVHEGSFFAFVACHCDGYHACAHKTADGLTEIEAMNLAVKKWNTRFTQQRRKPA